MATIVFGDLKGFPALDNNNDKIKSSEFLVAARELVGMIGT